MKVLYVDQTGKLGGGEIAILPWLKETAHEAHVVLLEDGPFRELLEEAGVQVEVLLAQAIHSVRRESGVASLLPIVPAFLELRRGLRRLAAGADAVYANSQKAFLIAAMAKRRGQPLIWHLRDILTADHFSPMMRRVAVLVGNRMATAIIVNSHATAEALIAAGGDRRKVRVVHDGVSAEAFDKADPGASERLRSQLGLAGKTVVGVFGRLSPWKAQHILIEAIATLPEVHAVLVGDALFGEDEYKRSLQELALRPEVAGRVHFLGFQRDVPGLMKAMDIVVHCSTSPEPFGLVIVEGMLARRPVIAANAGGAMEIVVDGESGLLVTPGNPAELAAAIQRLLLDRAWADHLAQAGRLRAESEFSVERMFAGTRAVLAEVLR